MFGKPSEECAKFGGGTLYENVRNRIVDNDILKNKSKLIENFSLLKRALEKNKVEDSVVEKEKHAKDRLKWIYENKMENYQKKFKKNIFETNPDQRKLNKIKK